MDLSDLSWPAVAALPRHTPVVIPIAALEQHGHHLPLFTDSLLLGEVIRRIREPLADKVLFAPLTWLGNSDHHLDFQGTLSAPPRTYLDLLSGLAENFTTHGFHRIIFLNGHGGNDVPGRQAVFELRQRHRQRTDLLLLLATYWNLGAKPWESDPTLHQREMGHACEWETSMILRLAPHLVGRIPIAALANPPALVELFAETIVEELDFRMEAANMIDVASMLHDLGQTGYVVPRPHPTLVTRRVLVMQRVNGFNFDDVVGMKDAGIDTEDVVRTAMVALMEGAMVYGVFHGDLHGGNLFVLADGRTALLDFGIVGRLTGERRLAFLRMMLAATTNDVPGQMAAMRDLGALPPDTDLAAVIRDLRLDLPPIDPTSLTGEELVSEMQRVVKALMGYGARMPKELMLYVKNMVFLDGAMARLAPDLDLIAEIAKISMMFAERHGERLGRELGIDHTAVELNMDGVKAGFGVDTNTESLTYRELQARRDLISKRMRDQVAR